MRQQRLLDLRGRDVLPAAQDHLLEAALQVQVAVAQHATVPRAEPGAEERLGGGRRVVHVSRHHARTADHHLAQAALGQHGAVLIGDADLGARRHADGTCDPLLRRQRVRRHLVAGLGHPVRLEHRHAVPELGPLHQRG